MPCYKPLDAWRPLNSTGSKKLVFSYHPARCGSVMPDLKVPCGRCVGCRLERSRQWAIRCVHEAQLHKNNCFITLTYDKAKLPEREPGLPPADISLHYPDFQKFMKRLRFKYGEGIRFYMCGEYGEKLGRPHFHACIFGHDFSDKKVWKKTDSGSIIYRSAELEELWPYGFSSVGDVNFESAAYVARYIMKKISGEAAESHYRFFRPIHRGDIQPPSRVHADVVETRTSKGMVRKVPHRCVSPRPRCNSRREGF